MGWKLPRIRFLCIRNLTKGNNQYIFWKENVPLYDTRTRELFIQAFKLIVSDIKSYVLHSLRSGGATSTCNFGVRGRLFKRHGRWRSELILYKNTLILPKSSLKLISSKCSSF